jgi:uncharacterized protein (TIGR02284 family)
MQYLPLEGCFLRRTLAEAWLAGARDFRDFFRLPPAQENRGQPADPTPARSRRRRSRRTPNMSLRGIFMATDTAKNFELETALKSVINSLEDGQKGMAEIGEHLKDEILKRYCLAESLKRASFRGELENELHRHGVHDVQETGTVVGSLQRAWSVLKARLGGGDNTLLATAEEGEDEAEAAYRGALDLDLPLPVRQLLTEQQTQILISHDYLRAHREALKEMSRP